MLLLSPRVYKPPSADLAASLQLLVFQKKQLNKKMKSIAPLVLLGLFSLSLSSKQKTISTTKVYEGITIGLAFE